MPRLLVFLTLAYVSGISLGRYLTQQMLLYVAVVAILWAIWNILARREGGWVFVPLFLLFVVAGSLAFNFAVTQVGGSISEDDDGRRCTLTGMVADEPLWREDSVVFPLRLQAIEDREGEMPASGKLRVTLYYEGQAPEISYGREISVTGVITIPAGQRNPGGFDYRSFLETRGMSAAFHGNSTSLVTGDFSPSLSPLRLFALGLKEKMQAVLRAQLPPAAGNLLVAILFGERQALDPGVEEGVRRSGVAHLMAVSGLHVGLLAAMLLLLFKRVGLMGWPACLLLILLLFSYTYLTGLKPSTLRAFIMIAMGAGALCLGRRKDLPTAVAVAALFTLIYNPLLLFHVGMQLSYAATIAILIFTEPLQRAIIQIIARLPHYFHPSAWQDYGAGLIAVTIAAQLGILPLIAYYFKEISIVALPANILILPVMAILLGIGLFTALWGLVMPAVAALFSLAAYPLLAYILLLTGWMGSGEYAAITVFPPRPLEILIYYSVLLLVAWQGGEIRRYSSILTACLKRWKMQMRPFHLLSALLIVALPFTWWGLPRYPEKELEVVFLDVGQGDAIFIRTPGGSNILLDSGGRPAFMDDLERPGRLVVVPYLEYRRVKKLDMVIVSHPHEDHYGGLLAVLERFPAGLLVTNAEEVETESYIRLLELADAKGIPRMIMQKGDNYLLEPSLELEVLAPPARLFKGTVSDVNNNSLVMRLIYREVSFLFTGDIEDAAANWLLREGMPLKSTVLKVPHHGGYMPAFSPFLEAVGPEAAVIQVGRNTFGHPHPETVAILEQETPEVYRNDQHGAVIIHTDGHTWRVNTLINPIYQTAVRGRGSVALPGLPYCR